jgi:alpha-beta hydrolase superfamily lysophospholipase
MLYIAQKRIKPRLKRIGLIIIGFYIMVGMALFFFQEKILFRPSTLPQEHEFKFDHEFEELFITAKDNAVINALHFKVENPLGVILYFHGNAGDLQRWGSITEYFVKMKYDVLVMDYRTYGKSTGSLSESILYDDGQMCYNYLLQRYSESDITIYGRSLGSGIATKLASDNQPKALILESPFYSVADVAKHRFPMFPVSSLLNYKFPNFQHLENVKCPVTIFHGTEDIVVPFSSGKKLVSESNKDQIDFIPIKGGGHNNLIKFEAYDKGIKTLLKE